MIICDGTVTENELSDKQRVVKRENVENRNLTLKSIKAKKPGLLGSAAENLDLFTNGQPATLLGLRKGPPIALRRLERLTDFFSLIF